MKRRDTAQKLLTHYVNRAKALYPNPQAIGRICRAAQIIQTGKMMHVDGNTWTVYRQDGTDQYYTVVKDESCDCPDRQWHTTPCKHMYAVGIADCLLHAMDNGWYAIWANMHGILWPNKSGTHTFMSDGGMAYTINDLSEETWENLGDIMLTE